MPQSTHSNKLRIAKFWLLSMVMLSLTACVSVPPRPSNTNNACSIFSQYPNWYKNAKQAQQRWGVPVSTQLAIINQESSFIGNAKPPRQKLLLVFPWKRPSTSYGYAQALHTTWMDYQRSTGNRSNRDSFAASTDFVSWYVNSIHRQTGIPVSNVYAIYLAYHDGAKGYMTGTYRKKTWLINVAKRVQYQAQRYENQLKYCIHKL